MDGGACASISALELAIGIDVGFSANKRSTGVIIMDRATKAVASGSRPVVAKAAQAIKFLQGELRRLKPSSFTTMVDGSFACAADGANARAVERFFSCGPFASVPSGEGLRLRLTLLR